MKVRDLKNNKATIICSQTNNNFVEYNIVLHFYLLSHFAWSGFHFVFVFIEVWKCVIGINAVKKVSTTGKKTIKSFNHKKLTKAKKKKEAQNKIYRCYELARRCKMRSISKYVFESNKRNFRFSFRNVNPFQNEMQIKNGKWIPWEQNYYRWKQTGRTISLGMHCSYLFKLDWRFFTLHHIGKLN